MSDPAITVSDAGFEFPVVEILTGRGVIFGKSGSGKSNTVGVVVEQLLDQGYPVCIVDADGEHYGLKEEFELLHVGGDESADVQVGPDHAEHLAEIMLHEDVPVILDISGYVEEDEAHELVERVVQKLFSMEKKAKKPFPVFVEEIHELVPETKSLDSVGQTIVRAAKRGRKHGLGIVGASQRPASVKKSLTTQASWSVWHRLSWTQDTNVLKEIADKEHAEAVQNLDTGEAIVLADWMDDDPRTIQFKRKRTFDAGATPGLEEFETPELKAVSDAVVDRLESVSAEKAEDEAERDRLESELDDLREEKRELEAELEELRSGDVVESEEIDRLESRVETLREERDELEERVREEVNQRREIEDEAEALAGRVSDLEARLGMYEEAHEHIKAAAAALGVDAGPDELESRIEELERENRQLRTKLEEGAADAILPEDADYLEFVDQQAVLDAIDRAKEDSYASPRYVEQLVAAIVEEGGPVGYDVVADQLDIEDTSNVGKAASALEEVGVVEKSREGGLIRVDLNTDGIEDVISRSKKAERAEEIAERF